MTEEPQIVKAKRMNNVAVIDLAATFYTSTKMAQEFRKLLNELMAEQVYFLVINMRKVQSIDSEGLGALSSAYKMCKHNNGMLVISDVVNEDVVEVLEIVNLDKIIPIYKTEQEALQVIQKSVS